MQTRAKSRKYDTPNAKVDQQGNLYFELTGAKRISVSKYRGLARVDMRNYYRNDLNELLPTKKGISMRLEDYAKLKEFMPEIEKLL